MNTKLKLTVCLIIFSTFTYAQTQTRWVQIGEGTYNQGFIYPYKIKFSVPYGVRNIADIKLGLYTMQFKLEWLLLQGSKEGVKKLFNKQLEQSFKSKEGFKLYKSVIESFLEDLPTVKKHDVWVFVYNPDEGTKLYIQDQLIHHLVGSELNQALVQSWINKDPMLTSILFNRLIKVQK